MDHILFGRMINSYSADMTNRLDFAVFVVIAGCVDMRKKPVSVKAT